MEEVDNKFLRACLAEFLAMHLFVLLCCGCAMVTFNLSSPNLMMIAASFGFGILVLAQIFGPLSGGHINNAVSFALFLAGRISFLKMMCYTFSQMLGSVFGALFLWAIFGTHWPAARAFGSNSWDESVFTGGQVFFGEMLGTMLLIFNVLSTIDIPKEGGGPLGIFPIAMSVMVAHLFLLPIDGCSINPARSFGPSLVAGWAKIPGTYDHQQAVFWFGPLFGAGVAALLYEYGSLKPENFAGAKDMDTALFQANKRKIRTKRQTSVQMDFTTVYNEQPKDAYVDPTPTTGSGMVDNPLHNVLAPAPIVKSVTPAESVPAPVPAPIVKKAPKPTPPVPDTAPKPQPAIVNPNDITQTQHVPFHSPPPPVPIIATASPRPDVAPPPVPPMQFGDNYNEFEDEAL